MINGTRFVSPELRERVMAAVAELDYRPNAVAQSLRQKRTRTIGLIVPDNSNPFFAEVAKGVEDAGYEAGVSVILCNSDGSFDRELRYLQLLRDKQVEGVIFIATTPRVDHLAGIVERAIPAVVFYRNVPQFDVDTLVVDNFGGGCLATRHLIELGHTRIACVAPASTDSPSSLRVSGFRRAMEEAGLPIDEALIYRGDNRFAGGRDGAEYLLATGKPFTAVFAGNDVMAVGAMRTLPAARARRARRRLGRRVRRDRPRRLRDPVADDRSSSRATRPGGPRFRLLLERIEEEYAGPPRAIELETELVVRESTAPPPVRRRRDAQTRRNAVTYITRDELLEVCRLVYDRWLTNAGGSNFSGRISADSVLLTPTGNAKRTRLRMSPDHLLHVRLDGTVLEGDGELSSSWPTHQGLYRAFPEIGAVIHAHPLYATIFAARAARLPVAARRHEEVRHDPAALRPQQDRQPAVRRGGDRGLRGAPRNRRQVPDSACSTPVTASSSPARRSTTPTTCWSGWSSTPPRSSSAGCSTRRR